MKKMLLFLILGLVLVSGCLKEQYGSISGTVIPADKSIMVNVIQDGSSVNTVWVKEDGTYNITGLKPGRYGLLFSRGRDVYVYKYDEIKNNLYNKDGIINYSIMDIILVKKHITSSNNNINLNEEFPHFYQEVYFLPP